jgi:hypothetical protein
MIRSFYYSAKILHFINGDYNKVSGIFYETFNLNLDDIVNFYNYYEN